MNITILALGDIMMPILVMGLLALALGVLITVVSNKFAVQEDQRTSEIIAILPGANCGGCGYSGCAGYAGALASGDEKNTSKCSVGGKDTAEAVSTYLGLSGGEFVPTVAQVHCQGSKEHTQPRFEYSGSPTCKAASLVHKGPGSCVYGCLGFGDCKVVCEFDAINIVDGLARIDPEKCTACGACVRECPKSIIHIIPKHKQAYVNRCSNPLPGAIVKKSCDIGCIGCTLCVKACPVNAISMKEGLAVIDQDICNRCGECIKVCPAKSITMGLVF